MNINRYIKGFLYMKKLLSVLALGLMVSTGAVGMERTSDRQNLQAL